MTDTAVQTDGGPTELATEFTDLAKQAEFVTGMIAWGVPLPDDAKPSLAFLLGYFTADSEYDLWQAELMARAYAHIDNVAIGFRLDDEGDLAPLKARESDEPQERTRGEILAEIAALSYEATAALVSAFDQLTATFRGTR